MTRSPPLAHALAAVLCLAASTAQAVTCQNGIPASNPDNIYTVHGNGTVTDTRTGLMWKQCLEGYGADNCTADGGTSSFTWNAALTLAESHEFAGHSDWRLPNLKELRSLVEECRNTPAINNDVFPNTSSSVVWSGSPLAGYPNFAWFVDFSNGNAFDYSRYSGFSVRLVRGGQSFAPLSAALQSTTASSATVAGTSSVAATGYWLVVPQGSAAPRPAQVKAQATYGGVMPVAQGNATMQADISASFDIPGLAAATPYDFYLVADAADSSLGASVQKVPFTTAALVAGACGDAHNTGSTPLLPIAPVADRCIAGTPSDVIGSTSTWGWSCEGNGGTATCQAPRGYTVTPLADVGGSISPDTPQIVAYLATPTFTASPSTGWRTQSISGCGGTATGAGENGYTTGPVTGACNVTATFETLIYTITATPAPAEASTAGGSVTCTPNPVPHGGETTCTATPQTGYMLAGWGGDCSATDTAALTCSLSNVRAHHTVSAQFSAVQRSFSGPTVPSAGTASGTATASITEGGGDTCRFDTASTAFVAAPATLPDGQTMPHGMLQFKLVGCDATPVRMAITWPGAVQGVSKWGRASAGAARSHFEPTGASASGSTTQFTVQDGQQGDDDWTENGEIVDLVGATVPSATPPAPASVMPVPTLSPWALGALGAGLLVLAARRRRKA